MKQSMRNISKNMLKYNCSFINNFSFNKQMLYFQQTFSYARKTTNYDLYLNKTNELLKEKSNDKKPISVVEEKIIPEEPKETKKTKTKKVKNQTEEETNTLKITPYFEGMVDKKELDFKTMNKKDNYIKVRGPGNVYKKIDEFEVHKFKKVQIIYDRIKRKMHDETLFRGGLTSEDLEGHDPLIKRAMSIDNASIGEFKKARMIEVRKLFGKHEKDTSSFALQACSLNERVYNMVAHLKAHPGDKRTKHALVSRLAKRRDAMMVLKEQDYNTYAYILKYYGIKDLPHSRSIVDKAYIRRYKMKFTLRRKIRHLKIDKYKKLWTKKYF